MKQIGVIGVGNMANAILNGIKKDKTYNIWIYDIDPAKKAAWLRKIACILPQAFRSWPSSRSTYCLPSNRRIWRTYCVS